MKVEEITERDFKDKINVKGKVLIDCYATWCGPCKMLSPVIDKLAEENTTCKFYKLDVDNAEKISEEYRIMSIPTLLIFEDGNLVNTSLGLKSKSEIADLIK